MGSEMCIRDRCKLLQVRAKYQGLTMWKKAECMQDFAMKIITSGTTLAELRRDCHTQAMVCATLAAHAVALPPPSTPRHMSRPLALALACAIAASTSHLQLALASPASATSSLSRLVRAVGRSVVSQLRRPLRRRRRCIRARRIQGICGPAPCRRNALLLL